MTREEFDYLGADPGKSFRVCISVILPLVGSSNVLLAFCCGKALVRICSKSLVNIIKATACRSFLVIDKPVFGKPLLGKWKHLAPPKRPSSRNGLDRPENRCGRHGIANFLQHFHNYSRDGWSQVFPMRIGFSWLWVCLSQFSPPV